MGLSIEELVFPTQGQGRIFTAITQGKFLPARRAGAYTPGWLVPALRLLGFFPLAAPRLRGRHFLEAAIARLDAEVDLFDGGDQVAAQCGRLGLGAMALQAVAQLGVGLGS